MLHVSIPSYRLLLCSYFTLHLRNHPLVYARTRKDARRGARECSDRGTYRACSRSLRKKKTCSSLLEVEGKISTDKQPRGL